MRDERLQPLPHLAAIYVRVSKPEQAAPGTVSIDTQLAGCSKWALDHGFPGILPEHVFHDTHTGEELYERPGLTQLREAAKTRAFDTVIVWVLDRLGRDPVHQVIVMTELERYGVKVELANENIDDTPEGRLIRYVKGLAAQIENTSHVERSIRAKRERARRGTLIYGNRPMYGYRFNEDKTAYTPDPVTSLVVIRIFKEAAAGVPLRQIARALEDEGVPTPVGRNSHWHFTSIRNILVKSGYWGKHTVFKTRSVKLTPDERPNYKYRTRRVTVPDEDAIVLPTSVVPPLISEEIAILVRARLRANQEYALRNVGEHHATLLRSGFIRCGYCGRALVVMPARDRNRGGVIYHNDPYYVCSRANKSNGGCKAHTISAPIADKWVWDKIRLVILNEQIIWQEVERLESGEDPAKTMLDAIDAQIKEAERKLASLARTAALTEDECATGVLVEEMTRISKQKQGFEAERGRAEAHFLNAREVRAGLIQLSQWREQISNQLDALTLNEQRDILIALQVSVKLYDTAHDPRMELSLSLPLSGEMPVIEDSEQICVLTPAGVIPIGHGAPDVPSPSLKRGRKPTAEFAHYERW
ncbi:MAG TPA: recombinase family protein [Ktedonobacterales bacterium]